MRILTTAGLTLAAIDSNESLSFSRACVSLVCDPCLGSASIDEKSINNTPNETSQNRELDFDSIEFEIGMIEYPWKNYKKTVRLLRPNT